MIDKKMLALLASASLISSTIPAHAGNPFSDVPTNHWAYDAVETLAAKGLIEGYPDDTFRGEKAMTRYEIASIVARMMTNENTDSEDIEQLKALAAEFGPELEALGVKVDGFDSRLSAIEKNMSGWKISGQMFFDYKALDYDDETNASDTNQGEGRTGFHMSRARIFLHRDLPQGISFDARWADDSFDRFYLTARNFLGINGLKAKLGKFIIDPMADDKMHVVEVTKNDTWQMGANYNGAELSYSNGQVSAQVYAASRRSGTVYDANVSSEYYGAKLRFDFNEKFWVSFNGLWINGEDDANKDAGTSYDDYWIAAGYKFGRGAEIRGLYAMQEIDQWNKEDYEDDADAFKIILDFKQSYLKFTRLWVEYSKFDEGYILHHANHTMDIDDTKIQHYLAADKNGMLLTDHEEIYVYANQKWGSGKLSTFEIFDYADAEGDDYDDMTSWTLGIGYQYSPALYFEVSYTDQDGNCQKEGYEDRMFRFRTRLDF